MSSRDKIIFILLVLFLLIFIPLSFAETLKESHSYIRANGKIVADNFYNGTTTQLYYYHYDALGNLVRITDSQGKVVESQRVEAFGNELQKTKTVDVTDRSFIGKEKDSNNLFYFGARYYDANTGRFISSDPLSGKQTSPETMNKYSYAVNNPLKYVDMNGKDVELTGTDEERKNTLDNLNKLVGGNYFKIQKKGDKYLVVGTKNIFQKINLWLGGPKYEGSYNLVKELVEHKETVQIHIASKENPAYQRILMYEGSSSNPIREFLSNPSALSNPGEGRDDVFYMAKETRIFSSFTQVKSTLSGVNEVWYENHQDRINGQKIGPEIILAHELGHALLSIKGDKGVEDIPGTLDMRDIMSLGGGVCYENIARQERGIPIRTEY